MLSGENVVEDVPEVTPFSTAQATALAQSVPAEISVKLAFAEGVGRPAAFHIYITAMLRVQGMSPPKVPPETIPFS